jgi:hypothetical protein
VQHGGFLHPKAAGFEVRVEMNCSNIMILWPQRQRPRVPPRDVPPFLSSDQIPAVQNRISISIQLLLVMTSLAYSLPDVLLPFPLQFDA